MQTGTLLGGEGLNIPEGDQIFKAMSEILGPMGPNISTTIEIFGPGGQNITGDQISCDSAFLFRHVKVSLHNIVDVLLVQISPCVFPSNTL